MKAKYNNQRIINQQGAFFLFGLGLDWGKNGELKYKKTKVLNLPEDWIRKIKHKNDDGEEIEENKITIPKDKKASILNELNVIGINKSFIFPELEKYAEELKEKIK